MDVQNMTVAQVMSRSLVAVGPDESPLMAWEIMRRADIHHLPVVDGNGHLCGILTREDLTTQWSGGPAEQSSVPVHTLLVDRRCPHTSPEARLAEAAAAMVGAGVDAIPVLNESAIVTGIVTTTDVLRAVAGRLAERQGTPEL
ncbi:HPP family protein, partial [Streptosporangium sp. NPDC000396]|uniref:CBS domain-containing protein n=1 Tax=Streptosporangium sp. NPDC000396 TaxID=3366185 RepID=UPI003676AA53